MVRRKITVTFTVSRYSLGIVPVHLSSANLQKNFEKKGLSQYYMEVTVPQIQFRFFIR